ncbi:transposase, partial [Burkholderia ubonensis]|uniref:transposase n=1 Tax=Burkholderia ubonensis TaxID=101571 RepID=UPI001E2C9815
GLNIGRRLPHNLSVTPCPVFAGAGPRVAAKRAKIKAMPDGAQKDLMIALERTKAQIRARVEHPFHVVKNLFRHRKVRYKGLLKNTAQLFSLFALANLVIARNRLRSIHGRSPSSV